MGYENSEVCCWITGNKKLLILSTCICHRNAEAFLSCIQPMIKQCYSIRHKLRHHWLPVVEELSCACSGGDGKYM